MAQRAGVSVGWISRVLLTACVTGILLRPFGWAPAVQAYCAYVTNLCSANVSAIDTTKNQAVATIDVDRYPVGIAVTPDGNFAYVVCNHADPDAKPAWKIDTSRNQATPLMNIQLDQLGNAPWGIAITPSGRSAYVTVPRASALPVIDTARDAVTTSVVSAQGYFFPAVTPNGGFVYVTPAPLEASTRGDVSVIDTSKNAVVDTVQIDSNTIGVAITPDGRFAYVATAPANVSVIDTGTNKVVHTVQVGNGPAGVAITPDGRSVYVTNSQGLSGTAQGDVSVIDVATNTVVATVPVGNTPFGVAITPDGRFAYVTNSQGIPRGCDSPALGNVSVIDTSSHTVVSTIPVGNNPIGIGMCPEAQTGIRCVGDCTNDTQVTIDELLKMVNIALGTADNSACPHGIPAGATVDISLISQAVNNALTGCPGQVNA